MVTFAGGELNYTLRKPAWRDLVKRHIRSDDAARALWPRAERSLDSPIVAFGVAMLVAVRCT